MEFTTGMFSGSRSKEPSFTQYRENPNSISSNRTDDTEAIVSGRTIRTESFEVPELDRTANLDPDGPTISLGLEPDVPTSLIIESEDPNILSLESDDPISVDESTFVLEILQISGPDGFDDMSAEFSLSLGSLDGS